MTSKIILRVSILVLFGLIGYSIGMFGFHTSEATVFGAIWGLTIGLLTILSELILLRLPSLAILGGLIGGMLGLILANLLTGSSLFLHLPIAPFTSYIRTSLTILFFLVGLMVGVQRIQSLTLQSLRRLFTEQTSDKDYKILDTSVIIDGRIADISETGFLQGVLVIPQFILQELQHIADSPDPIKRNRGRRGLEILHKIQKRVDIQVEIHERDFPKIKEIDAKLVELGKYLQAKLITNDFNLNKVAELQGVPVLNVNQLANALKPVVLPGEVMEVLVLKEGKEYGQGIAYLDDGTMIVIDNAKKLIGKTVGVAVTSVLQTTAGRMIFGQLAAKDAMR